MSVDPQLAHTAPTCSSAVAQAEADDIAAVPLCILHISTRLILGGSQENTVLSCEGQARRGHRVHLAFGPIYGPEGSMLERVTAFNNANPSNPITTHTVPALVRQISPVQDLRCLGQLRALVRTLKPDVVHTHSSKAGILGRWAAWTSAVGRASSPSGRPAVVHTIHGPPWMPIEGSHLQQAKIRIANKIYVHAERFAAQRCHSIVAVADAMTRQFLDRSIGKPEQYTTVRSGMETHPYLHPSAGQDRQSVRTALGLRDDEFVVGIVARLAQHKGHDDLIDALGPIMRKNAALRMLWVGDGWWRDRLLGKLVHQGIDEQVTLTGLVPAEQIPGLMRAMDLLCHPSAREGLPRTVPQALLAGVPVVATDTDGTREVCLDPSEHPNSSTGLLVKVGDVQGLRDCVQWMIDHPDERTAMAQRGRTMCADMFSVERMLDDLERVYTKALNLAGVSNEPA